MPARTTESAPPIFAVEPTMQRRPDPAALRAGHMWREASRLFACRTYAPADEARVRRALAVIWDAAAATACGRDGQRYSPTGYGPRTRIDGRCGGRHLGRAERQALMSAAAAAYRAVCGVDFRA